MEDIIGIIIPSSFIVALIVERRFPARALPKVKGWLWKGLLFFAFTGFVNSAMPALIASLLHGHTPLHLTGLGTIGGALVAFVVSDFFGYWIHRLMHRVPVIWRWSHQMHHSAERMDLAGMSYNHPFDILLSFGLTGLAVTLLGVTPAAAALAGFGGYLCAVIQHANIKTPRWLGYFVMRPEAHGLHHERGVHAYNYANVPLWDVVFGTYRNPETFPAQYGFWDGASSRVGSLLVGRDVGQRP
jgi:sterol desaturase/sphingolipid hydroxylase (fatty acid hydroxylase superfamily)